MKMPSLRTLALLLIPFAFACTAGIWGNLQQHDHSSINEGGTLTALPFASTNGDTITTSSLNLVDIPGSDLSITVKLNHRAVVGGVVVADITSGAAPIQVRVNVVELSGGSPVNTRQVEHVITVTGTGGRISIPVSFASDIVGADDTRTYKLQVAVQSGTVYFEARHFWALAI